MARASYRTRDPKVLFLASKSTFSLIRRLVSYQTLSREYTLFSLCGTSAVPSPAQTCRDLARLSWRSIVHPPASVRVLSVSDYESIKTSREWLLQSAGYSVVSMSSDCALRNEIPRHIAIAVIGQTTDDVAAFCIAERLRRTQADIRILRLTMQYSRSGSGYDGC